MKSAHQRQSLNPYDFDPSPSRDRRHTPTPPDSLCLSLRPHAFFNQLLHLNQPRLIVRSNELTLFQETEFGVFFREPHTARPWLADPVSGLAIDPAEVSGIFLLHQMDAPSSFEICMHSAGFALAIQPTSRADDAPVQRIADSFGENSIDSSGLTAAGAGAWLDEEIAVPVESDDPAEAEPPLSFDRTSGKIEVCASGPGYGICDAFTPGFVDRDGDAYRIADATHRSVVFTSGDRFCKLLNLS